MKLAYVTAPGRGMTDDLIAGAVLLLEARGVRLTGTVRAKPVEPGAHPCDMDLRVLPDGPRFRISQPLGAGARGCHLDTDVIEAIAAAVEARLPTADLLIVNKFGKQEAHGRGLCPAIAKAIEIGIPVLVGVNQMTLSDFGAFAEGTAVHLPSDLHALCAWFATLNANGAALSKELT